MNYRHTIEYSILDSWKDLNEAERELVEFARSTMKNAYAPYSNFKVGASVLLDSGEIVCGSNQENIAYPSGLCAERVALFYAGANFPDNSVKTICIVAEGELLPKDQMLTPCGSCRQVMNETEKRQQKPFKVILIGQNENVVIFNSAADLLPFAFGTT